MREKIGTWNIICDFWEMDYVSMRQMLTAIIERDDKIFYLFDEKDKISDILKMPIYIQEDWVTYNKQELTLSIIDLSIKTIADYKEPSLLKDVEDRLKSIRRDFQINKII